MHRTSLVAAATLALVGAGLASGSTASGAPPDSPQATTVARGLVGPLSVAVGPARAVYYSQNFIGQIWRKAPGVEPKRVYSAPTPGDEAGALSWRDGVLTFAITPAGPSPERALARRPSLRPQVAPRAKVGSARLMVVKRNGAVRRVADLGAHEARRNPDGTTTYGFVGISDSCAASLPPEVGPPTYQGEAYSHPYASASTRTRTYVADAGANDVLAVNRAGKVRTVAVLPPVEVPVDADLAAGFGLPDCVVGLTYLGEPVPTDVEVRHGRLLVTTLGGGLGEALPLGAVHRINPTTGKVTTLVTGLSGPVGLAVAPRGMMFVSQLFGGEISKVRIGTTKVRPYTAASMPAAVEWSRHGLYATTGVMTDPPAGKVVRYRP